MLTLFPIEGVFSITCLYTGFGYVAYTKDIVKGVQTIFDQLERGQHRNPVWQEHFNACGRDQYIVRILYETDDEHDGLAFKLSLLNSNQYEYNRSKVVKSEKVKEINPALIVEAIELFKTPWGVFRRPSLATYDAPIGDVKQDWLRLVCYQPEAVITSMEYDSSVYLMYCHKRDVIGRTWGDLGFGTCFCDYKTIEKLGQIHRPLDVSRHPYNNGKKAANRRLLRSVAPSSAMYTPCIIY